MKHVNISGIKCDNPKCDYLNAMVEFEDYPNWVNKACPKCGENLLTQEDYDFCLNADNMVENFEDLLPEDFDAQLGAMLAAEGISEQQLKEIGSRISFDEVKEMFQMLGLDMPTTKAEEATEAQVEMATEPKKKKTRRSK